MTFMCSIKREKNQIHFMKLMTTFTQFDDNNNLSDVNNDLDDYEHE